MNMWFIAGLVIGFLVSFLVIKDQIKKSGAGGMKICETCPYYTAVTRGRCTDSEDNNG